MPLCSRGRGIRENRLGIQGNGIRNVLVSSEYSVLERASDLNLERREVREITMK